MWSKGGQCVGKVAAGLRRRSTLSEAHRVTRRANPPAPTHAHSNPEAIKTDLGQQKSSFPNQSISGLAKGRTVPSFVSLLPVVLSDEVGGGSTAAGRVGFAGAFAERATCMRVGRLVRRATGLSPRGQARPTAHLPKPASASPTSRRLEMLVQQGLELFCAHPPFMNHQRSAISIQNRLGQLA